MTISTALPEYAPPRAATAEHRPPAVSVIVPVYNTARYVAEAIDSVLAQTYADFEIIVVNDGSPDTPLLERVLEPYRGRITYIMQENRGSAGARNTALRAARGRYVAMLDSDDRYDPEYLASQVAVLEADPSVDVVYPDARRFGDRGDVGERYSERYALGGDVSFARVLARECQVYGEVTARREALLRVGMYDEELESGEDFELWLRVLKGGGRIAYNPRVLAYYRVREGSHTSNAERLNRNVLKLLEKVARTMELTADERAALEHQRTGVRAVLLLIQGKEAFTRGDAQTARAHLTEANRVVRSRKLRLAIVLLRVAPRTLLWVYRLRARLARER